MINVVTTQAKVAEVGREMCQNTAVKKVSFTGSTPVAKMLYGMAASTLKKYVFRSTCLDLRLTRSWLQGLHRGWRKRSVHRFRRRRHRCGRGRWVPVTYCIVRRLNGVAGAIICKFRGTGQTCVCANRIYVQSSIYAEFASRLSEKVAAFKVGNGLEKDTYVLALAHSCVRRG